MRSGDGRVIAAQIVVIAKEPLPGKVKTRLAPAYGSAGAAALALAALQDTLDAALARTPSRVVLALDGRAGALAPDGVAVVPQCNGSLGDAPRGRDRRRLPRLCPCRCCVIGMDTPQVTPALLDTCAARLDLDSPAVLGPADGRRLLVHRTAAARRTSLRRGADVDLPCTGSCPARPTGRLGLATSLLPPLRDVDLPSDVRGRRGEQRQAPASPYSLQLHGRTPHDRVSPRGVRRRPVARSDCRRRRRRGDCATPTGAHARWTCVVVRLASGRRRAARPPRELGARHRLRPRQTDGGPDPRGAATPSASTSPPAAVRMTPGSPGRLPCTDRCSPGCQEPAGGDARCSPTATSASAATRSRLLARVRELLAPDGSALVELDQQGTGRTVVVRLESDAGDGERMVPLGPRRAARPGGARVPRPACAPSASGPRTAGGSPRSCRHERGRQPAAAQPAASPAPPAPSAPGPLKEGAFTSRLRDERVASWLGLWLGIAFTVCLLTGLVDWDAQLAHPIIELPQRPVRFFQYTARHPRGDRHRLDPAAAGQAVGGLPQAVGVAAGADHRPRPRAS